MEELDLGATVKGLAVNQRVFGRYVLKRLLGRGGMGVVWLAQDETLETEVALKFLPEAVAHDPAAVNDLKRETRRSLQLTHPNIVRIFDFAQDARSAAISMEYVAGTTLTQLRLDQAKQVFEPDELGKWTEQVCAALDYAHTKAKVVHRDLKPANLMVDEIGDLKVADFGISATLTDSTTRVSKTAGTSGTPVYMSPQQMMGEKPAITDDVYALGATLYELLTGKPPFFSGRIEAQVMNKVPPSLTERRAELEVRGGAIPAAWEETIAACLAKEAGRRPQSAGEVARRLGISDSSARPEPVARASASGPKNEAKPGLKHRATAEVVAEKKSKGPLYAGLAVAALVLAGLGYYIGVYAPEQQRRATVEMARIATEAVRLAAARGGLVVRTTPAGAEVRFGDSGWSKAPLTLKEQKLGKYPVRVRLEGYEEWTGEIEVKENQSSDLDVRLVRMTGALAITSEPSGAEVYGEGKRLGVTPLNFPAVPPGDFEFEFRLKGYKSASVRCEVKAKETARAQARLEKIRGAEVGLRWTIPEVGLAMVPIAVGAFTMGDGNRAHSVTLTKPYWLGATEVTQSQWTGVMGSNPSSFKGENLPVEQVTWTEAMEFCRKLTERERAAGRLPAGYGYTLPSEAQWEYACRAGTTGDYAGELHAMAWNGSNSGNTTHAVGTKQANGWGLYDMHGNVWEWCADWYGDYAGGSVTEPRGPTSGTNRVSRGGGWINDASYCRSARRDGLEPGGRYGSLGFRLALSSVP